MKNRHSTIIGVRRSALYAGVSAIALLASGVLSQAHAANVAAMLSPAALAQSTGARTGSIGAVSAMAVPGNPALQAQQALSAANLAKAAQAIKDMNAAQAAARANSQLTLAGAKLADRLNGSAWNGAVLSGLKPVNDADSTLWINAEGLQKDTATATASVKQTAANALLSWQSFDLDTGETLVFDQQDHADWTVLNRIVAGPRDASGSRFVASPSMILGKIQAPGSVYVINPNGIIFGATAQINVHSLIASSLDVGNPLMSQGERDSFFLNTGILGNGGTIPQASFSYDSRDTKIEGDVKVEAGAIITTSLAPRSLSPDAGGFVYLFAPNVENDGSIITPAGETMLVSAQQVQLVANAYPDGGILVTSTETSDQTFRAVGVNTTAFVGLVPHPDVWRLDGPASSQISAPGSVTNRGLIDAERGVVILNGDNVINGTSAGTGAGIIRADTSVTRNGQIFLDARLQLSLDGSIQILPDENGETIPQSAIKSFNAGSIEMRGVTINLEPGALVLSPGGSVSASSIGNILAGIYPGQVREHLPELPARIYLSPDAVIDVSGLSGVTLPMSANLLTFRPFGNEFADSPLQRQGALRGQSLTVDIRESGTLNGVDWVGTPLANVSGFVNTIQRSLDQLLTTGGTVTLSAPASDNGEIILRQGSSINVGGGYVQYDGGNVATSKLLTADGGIVDIARADPLEIYAGIAGVTLEEHPKWGPTTTGTFENFLISGGTFQPGYIEGHDAGGITLDGGAYALEGSFYAGVVAGERQRLLGKRPAEATANTRSADANAMPSAGYLVFSGRNNLVISPSVTPLPDNFAPSDPVPKDRVDNTQVSAASLSAAQFGRITANFSGHVELTSDAALSVVPGGTISLSGGAVDIEGALTAHSGKILVESTSHIAGDAPTDARTAYVPTEPTRPAGLFDLTIGPAAVLDASGSWVNDTDASPEALIGAAYVDGGSVTLKTDARSGACSTPACTLPGLGNAQRIVDLTGDIVLSEGSRIDVSSGGRVSDHGVLQLDGKGRPVGKGGNVALQTYVGGFSTNRIPIPPTLTELTAKLVLGGSDGSPEANADALDARISAFGFAQGGVLSIQVPAVQIGGTVSSTLDSLILPADFFTGNAFGAYVLSSVAGSVSVESATHVILNQRNLLAGDGLALLALPTGAKPSQVAGIGYLPEIIRAPVNLTLDVALAPLPSTPYDPATASPAAKVALRIGEDAEIEGDPGASIVINVTGRGFWEGSTGGSGAFSAPIAQQIGVAEILGTVQAPGGSIALSANFGEVWLGAASRLDVSGVVVSDARQPFATGMILSGGKVSIVSTDPNSALVALHGAIIDVSGTAGAFDILRDEDAIGLNGPQRESTPVWSDAGSITFLMPTLLYDGGFAANPGASTGRGGSLTIGVPLPTGQEITVQQSGDVVPTGLAPDGDLMASLRQEYAARLDPNLDTQQNSTKERLLDFAFFQADRLKGSGIVDVTLSASPIEGDTIGTQGQFGAGRIAFDGDVTLGGLANLALDASRISLLDSSGGFSVVPPTAPDGCNVCLDAHYVALRGSGNIQILPRTGAGVLEVSGVTIDIAPGGSSSSATRGVLSLSGVGEARFLSKGDIRLRVPLANIPLRLAPGTLPAGELLTTGDVIFEAAQIYPVSVADITLKSIGTDNTITFRGVGTPAAMPLSAGGQVTVSAAHIEQGGRLLAPLGVIRLGARTTDDLSPNDPVPLFANKDPLGLNVPTQSVVLAPGSVTSVSLDGQTVPFGETANATSWSYDSQIGEPLEALPAKKLTVTGATIDAADGATIDFSGGGEVQAMEFVPGIGGSRDVLRNPNVYAVIPGYDPAAAPLDLDFLVQQGDSVPEAGRSVYLSGGGGLAAGYYTLLPAHYASLPGAYRISVVPNSDDALTSQNTVLPDGTARTAGYFAEPGLGTRDARTRFFDVQSSDVWRQYSEIDNISGTDFFGAKTDSVSGLPPRLPVDAGHGIFSAISGLNLDALIHADPASNGRGAELDIAARNLEILSPSNSPRIDYAGLDATQLSNLHVDSLLLGGVRNDTGDAINIVATSLEVANDASAPLEAPEIILASNPGPSLTFDAGSVVRAVGDLADPLRVVTVGHLHDKSIPNDPPNVAGNGALVAVSNAAPLTVKRENVPKIATDTLNGTITFSGPDATLGRPGALLEGDSLTLDTSGRIVLNSGAALKAPAGNISVSARGINLGQVTGTSSGFIVGDDILPQLEQAKSLSLRSLSQSINFYGNVDLTLGSSGGGSQLVLDAAALVWQPGPAGTLGPQTSGTVTISADDIALRNSGEAITTTPGGSALTINASQLTLGAGDKALGGFSNVTLSGQNGITLGDTGSIEGRGANLTIQSPLVLVGSGANQSLTTGGTVTFAGLPGQAPSSEGEIGGTLTVNAASIALENNAAIQASAGAIGLEANSGDIRLGAGTRILASGYEQDFFDVSRIAPGGDVRLIADGGNIDIAGGSAIDVSSPAERGGNAGSIALIAPNGSITSDGDAFDMSFIAASVAGDHGGRLKIDAQTLRLRVEGQPQVPPILKPVDLVSVPTLFSDTVDVHVSQGNLGLGADMEAANVTLTADRGVITIDRKIDASGGKGGTISLFGGQGVVLTTAGQLLARASDADERGGEIFIGTQVAGSNGSDDAGQIKLQGGLIDVSNTQNAANGGTVRLRAPLTNGDTDVTIDPVGTAIAGANSIAVEGFRVFDTHNSAFNGMIDPAGQPGFYGACTVSASGPSCSGTLIEFVQNFTLSGSAKQKFASLPSDVLHFQPGIELVNNDGGITVESTWNLGAGVAGYLEGDIKSRFGGTFQGYLVNDVEFRVGGQTVPQGTVVTDEFGKLLFPYRNYKGQLDFVDGISQVTTAVVTDEFGNLLNQFKSYKGSLFVIDGVSELKRTVVTDQYGIKTANYQDYKGNLFYVPGASQITSLYYRVGSSPTGEPGALTLRAAGDVQINGSITDGFFQTRNVFDATYLEALTAPQTDPLHPEIGGWLSVAAGGTNYNNVGGYLIGGATYKNPVAIGSASPGPAPVAPFDAAANAISPAFSGKDKVPLTGADLFPLIADPDGPLEGFDGKYRAIDSWSYRIAGGADTASANPLALKPLADLPAGNGKTQFGGSVVIDGDRQYNVLDLGVGSNVTYVTPTIVRTGTGSIDIAAGRDFLLKDEKAPGVVYTAGRNSVALPDPGFTLETIADPLAPGETVRLPKANTPAGFLEPIVLSCSVANTCNPYGPLGKAAYPVGGGRLTLTVQRDIIGFEHPVIVSPGNGTGYDNQQYFAPWLLAQGTALPLTDFGAFSPLSGYLSTGEVFTPSQTSWWINFGSFDQGLLSAGGDVRIEAGRDIQELAVSLPTTARVAGGLSSTIIDAAGNTVANVPVIHLNESGDLTVIAGRDLKSGAYYEGSGDAKIVIGGSMSASWFDREDIGLAFTIPVSTVLAVDTGTMTLTARGNADIAGVVSGASLQNVADLTGIFDVQAQSVSTYGASSSLRLQSIAGDLITNSLTFANALVNNANLVLNLSSDPGQAYPGINRYPANFEAVALKGNLEIADSFRLASSDTGTLDILAYDSIHTFNTAGSGGGVRPISTGLSLVEATFDAANPLAGFGPSPGTLALDLGAHLAHADDAVPDLLYAATGDIISGPGSFVSSSGERPLSWEINKPAQIRAARDIIDLSFFGQNLRLTDTTQIIAGRDLFYTGALQQLVGLAPDVLGEPPNFGGLSLAGPGFFDVEAGRNLGPFVTAAADIAASIQLAPDPTGTGIITFGNTAVAGNRRMLSDQNPALADPFAKGANDKLPRQGAEIVALFGVGNDPDYAALEKKYISNDPSPNQWLTTGIMPAVADVLQNYVDPNDPDKASRTRDYGPVLQAYVQNFGFPAATVDDAWATFQTLPVEQQIPLAAGIVANELRIPAAQQAFIDNLGPGGAEAFAASPALQHIFDDKIFLGELRMTGDSSGCCFKAYSLGYSAIETLFPPSRGYTDNRTAAGSGTAASGAITAAPGGLVNSANIGVTADANTNANIGFGDYPSTPAESVKTGDLELLHATIKTTQSATIPVVTRTVKAEGTELVLSSRTKQIAVGGDVTLLAPGGGMNIGTTAAEINQKLRNSSVGILTLNNGAIDIFTDGSVLVNQSRILTVQGGDLTMWSSNGDIDAGRGAKTTIDFKPLSVDFDPRDLQTINLNGLVSGAGIGTIQSTPDAPPASVFIIASRGAFNAGDAGARSSANISIAAQRVIGAANIAAQGAVAGVPQVSVDLGTLASATMAGGQAAQAAAEAVAAAASQGTQATPQPTPSLITVEVLGFGNCNPESGMPCVQQPQQ